MKKLLITLTLLFVITATNFTVVSQTNDSSTAGTKIVTIDQTIGFLLKENAEKNDEIAAKEQRIADLETQVAVEQENSASISKSYAGAVKEIGDLKSANAVLRQAVATNQNTIALLQADNAKKTEKAKKATKAKWKAYGIAAVTILVTYVLH